MLYSNVRGSFGEDIAGLVKSVALLHILLGYLIPSTTITMNTFTVQFTRVLNVHYDALL